MMERDLTQDSHNPRDERPTFFSEPRAFESDDRPTFFAPPVDVRPTTIGNEAKDTDSRHEPQSFNDGASSFRPGEKVLGKYKVLRKIKGGQEAEAYEAEDESGNRFFIKQLYDSRSTEDRKKRLAKIKDRLLSLSHPNLVQPISVTLGPSRICEVYSFVEGLSLAEWRRKQKPTPQALRDLLAQISSALHYLHTNDFAHRDVKPENITVVDGSPLHFVLTDYGLLVATDEGGQSFLGGTRDYLPPEGQDQSVTVERNKDLFPWDWWALGRVVQEMILGRDCVLEIMERSGSSPEVARNTFFKILAGYRAESFSCLPGMVELMSFQEFAAFELPLKGLLSANFRKRWQFEQIEQWLAGSEPAEYYAEPAMGVPDRAFQFRGMRFSSLRQVAQHFSKDENWLDGERQIRGGLQRSELRNYISDVLEDTKLAQQIRECNALAESISSDAKAKFDPKAVDALVTALALTCIGNAEQGADMMPLVIRGEIIDANYLAQASFSNDATRRDILRLVFSQDVCNFISTFGAAEFGGVLGAIKSAEDVRRDLGLATDPRIADGLPLIEFASVIADGQKAVQQLTNTVSSGKENFHHSDYTRLQSLIANPNLSLPELRVVAFAFRYRDAAQFKLITHGEFEREERERLSALRGNLVRAEQLAWRIFIPLCRPIVNANPRLLAVLGFIIGLFGVRGGWIVPFYSAGVLAGMGRLARWFMNTFDNTSALMDENISQLNNNIARLLNVDSALPFLAVRSAIRKFNHDITQLRSGGLQRISPSVKWQPLVTLSMLLFGFLFGPVLIPVLAAGHGASQLARRAPVPARPATVARNAVAAASHSNGIASQRSTPFPLTSPRRVTPRKVPSNFHKPAIASPQRRSNPTPAPTAEPSQVAQGARPSYSAPKQPPHDPSVTRRRSSAPNSEAAQIAGLVNTSNLSSNACDDVPVAVVHPVPPQAPPGMAESTISGANGVVRVYVNVTGNVASETILRSTGDPNLDKSILQAAMSSTYSSAKSGCKAQNGSIDVTEIFP